MRIKSIHLQNYKRFTDLRIADIPDTTRLVVMVGPNGSGKSSVFDALLFKARYIPEVMSTSLDDYYYKDESLLSIQPRHYTNEIWQQMNIGFHSSNPTGTKWRTVFHVRSPYRNEPDFTVNSISSLPPAAEHARFNRIIDTDQAVLDNYQRLVWKRQTDLDSKVPGDTTFAEYRASAIAPLQFAVSSLFPDLSLKDFGGLTGDTKGFRFEKGAVTDFPYKNLSGGEKAAFDLLLDLFVKREEFEDAIYCIDEPEAHIAVAIQGKLLESLLSLLPPGAQLWIATHSVGFIRAASQRSEENQDVVFLDFGDSDFDKPIVLKPRRTSRSFWRGVYGVALADLAALVGPDRIVLCEGNRDDPAEGHDARCYTEIFGDKYGDTLFLSRGAATQVERSDDLKSIIQLILEGIEVLKLIDRDDMTDKKRTERLVEGGVRVLDRRELENYLYDREVLETLFRTHGKDTLPVSITRLLVDAMTGDTKKTSRQILDESRKELPHVFLGNNRREFEVSHLAPALRETDSVYRALEACVFCRP